MAKSHVLKIQLYVLYRFSILVVFQILPCKNSKISHFKPIFSMIIPIQFGYYEYIRNKLNFLRFLILIKSKLDGSYWKILLYLPNISLQTILGVILNLANFDPQKFEFLSLQTDFFRDNSHPI